MGGWEGGGGVGDGGDGVLALDCSRRPVCGHASKCAKPQKRQSGWPPALQPRPPLERHVASKKHSSDGPAQLAAGTAVHAAGGGRGEDAARLRGRATEHRV